MAANGVHTGSAAAHATGPAAKAIPAELTSALSNRVQTLAAQQDVWFGLAHSKTARA